MKRNIAFFFCFLVVAVLARGGAAFGQDDALPALGVVASLSGLTVHGHAELKVMPDVAYVTISITTQSRSQADASQENATQSQAVTDVLKKSAIDDKDIQTQYYMVSPQYDYTANPPVLTGYQATNSLHVTIRNLPKVGIIMDKAVRAGATEVGGVSFDLSDRHKVEGEVLVDAISNARSKADLMAGAAGISLGRPLSLTEGTPPVVQPIFVTLAMSRAAGAADQAPSTQISPQQITATADVTAVYSILPAH